MSADRVIIEPQISRLQRFEGWLIIGVTSVMIGVYVPCMTHLPRPPADELPQALFLASMLLVFLSMAMAWGIRQALETQKWIAGPDFFECRSQLLGLRWSKTYHAEFWNFECIVYDSYDRPVYYALRPIGAHVHLALMPFYRTSNGRDALDLGRQLALVTGWPVNLPVNYERLEKEL